MQSRTRKSLTGALVALLLESAADQASEVAPRVHTAALSHVLARDPLSIRRGTLRAFDRSSA